MSGKLLLLPNLLDEEGNGESVFPPVLGEKVASLQGLIAESEKMARRYLRKFISHEAMQSVKLALLNEHTEKKAIETLLAPIEAGETWGLISDAGLPCIADPGAELVWQARQKGLEIATLVGPCSPVLALQLSGFSGQRFCFHGYLPKEEGELRETILQLEKRALGETQIWIETPYRTQKMFEFLKKTLQDGTRLAIATSLTTPRERCLSFSLKKWKLMELEFEKEPAIFLLYRSLS